MNDKDKQLQQLLQMIKEQHNLIDEDVRYLDEYADNQQNKAISAIANSIISIQAILDLMLAIIRR